MSYGYFCQNCNKIRFDGVPKIWRGKTVCRVCYAKLIEEERLRDLKIKEKHGIQKNV